MKPLLALTLLCLLTGCVSRSQYQRLEWKSEMQHSKDVESCMTDLRAVETTYKKTIKEQDEKIEDLQTALDRMKELYPDWMERVTK